MADTTVRTDDLEAAAGRNITGTVENPVERLMWAFDGTAYQIDLTAKNRAAFESAIKKFRDASVEYVEPDSKPVRKSSPAKKSGKQKEGVNPNSEIVREWAAGKRIPCPARGRVPKAIYEQWEKETGLTYAVNGSEPAATGSTASPAGQPTETANAS